MTWMTPGYIAWSCMHIATEEKLMDLEDFEEDEKKAEVTDMDKGQAEENDEKANDDEHMLMLKCYWPSRLAARLAETAITEKRVNPMVNLPTT